MKNRLYTLIYCFALVLWSLPVCTQIPVYYQAIDFSTDGAELMEQLSILVSQTHTVELEYSPGVWDALKMTDLDPDNEELVLLIYGYDDGDGNHVTDRTRGVDENCSTSDCTGFWNREHVLARSHADPSLELFGPGTDAHHIRASDAIMNEIRANRKFAEGSGNAHITPQGNFYPGEEWKGDVARMLMYMYIRYGDRCHPSFSAEGESVYDPGGMMIDILLEWNAADPVSNYELSRNDILEDLQGNRNPFIDNPYLSTLIWEGPEAEDRWMISTTEEPTEEWMIVYPTVTDDFIYFTNTSGLSREYAIYNLFGQLMRRGYSTGEIDLSQTPSSWYIIHLENEGFESVHRIFKK